MKHKQLVHLLQDNFKTVKVRFYNSSNNLYTYKAPIDEVFEENDLVVVPTSDRFQVAVIASVDNYPDIDPDSDINYRWLVQKVDLTTFNRMAAIEKDAAKMLHDLERKAQQKRVREQILADAYGRKELDNREVDQVILLLNQTNPTKE